MKKILILSANPISTNKLRLDEEVRGIRSALERAQKREVFELITREAVCSDDLRQTLLDNNPIIVHFSGHGTGSNGLVLENILGEPQIISTESLSDLFELFKEQVECVLLNACYSEIQASAIHKHIDCVIGMTQPIQDDAAIDFSKGFYDAIFSGRDYVDAFRFGCNNIDLNNIPESHTPTIKVRHRDLSPQQQIKNNTYKLVIATTVFGLSTCLIGLISLAFGNAEPMTNVLLAFGSVTLWMCCAYIYYPSSRIFGFDVTLFRLPKQYKRLRRLALTATIIISLLSAIGFYVEQLPTKDIIVLLADFESSSEQKNDRVTKNISEKLEDSTRKYSDIKIQPLNKFVTESKEADREGKKHKATIVIWGDYGKTPTTVQLNPHFEVLRPPKYFPKIKSLEQTAAISELNSFKLQISLSHELVYLSLFTVGLIHYTSSDWNKAIDSFNDALQQVKESIKKLDMSIIYFYRGNAYGNLKKYDLAIADYNQALKFDPKFAYTYNNRGNAYGNLKKYDLAIADYNQALKIDPKFAYAYNNNRGLAYYDLKKYALAINDYNQALKIEPKLAKIYYNRGLAYDQLEKYALAINDYNQALKIEPKYAKAYNKRGLAYHYLKKDNLAINDYNKALKIDHELTNAYFNRGAFYYQLKKYALAINDYNQALKIEPKFTYAYFNRGVVYNQLKKYDLAIADYNQALKIDPKYADAYDNRCKVYGSKGDYDLAITDCEQAIKLLPNMSDAYYNRGLAYKNKGNKDKAIEDFKKVLQLDDDADNDFDLKEKAKQELEKIIS